MVGMNLTKEINRSVYNTLLNVYEIHDSKRWVDTPHSWIGSINIIQTSIQYADLNHFLVSFQQPPSHK